MKNAVPRAMLLLALLALLPGCDRDVTSPQLNTEATVQASLLSDWQIARARSARDPNTAWKLIDMNGGVLRLGDNEVAVAPGAVLQPTWFQLALRGGDLLVADLNAYRTDGTAVTVFALNSIRVTLSYSDAVVQAGQDVGIAYLPDGSTDGLVLPLPSRRDPQRMTVHTYLSHFSTYSILIE